MRAGVLGVELVDVMRRCDAPVEPHTRVVQLEPQDPKVTTSDHQLNVLSGQHTDEARVRIPLDGGRSGRPSDWRLARFRRVFRESRRMHARPRRVPWGKDEAGGLTGAPDPVIELSVTDSFGDPECRQDSAGTSQ